MVMDTVFEELEEKMYTGELFQHQSRLGSQRLPKSNAASSMQGAKATRSQGSQRTPNLYNFENTSWQLGKDTNPIIL